MPCYPEYKAHSWSGDAKPGDPCECGKMTFPTKEVQEEIYRMAMEEKKKID